MAEKLVASAPYALPEAAAWRHRMFAREFFANPDPLRAYKVVYGEQNGRTTKPTAANILRLMQHPGVQAAMREEFARLTARIDLQQDRTLLELCRVAYSDMREVASWGPDGVTLHDSDTLSEDTALAIEQISSRKRTVRHGAGETAVESSEVDTTVKLHSKMQALRQLQEFFRRGDPLSVSVEEKLRLILIVMAQYVPSERMAAFRAHIRAAFGCELPAELAPGVSQSLAAGESG